MGTGHEGEVSALSDQHWLCIGRQRLRRDQSERREWIGIPEMTNNTAGGITCSNLPVPPFAGLIIDDLRAE